jgi:hypothetical protein
MAINPVRFTPMEFPDNPRPVPIDFSPLADIGRMYGQYRDRQEVGQLLQGAIDPKTGMLDLNRATTALAISGRDPETYLRAATAQSGLARQEAAQRALEQHYLEQARANKVSEEQRQQQLDQPQQTIVPPTLLSPGYVIQAPKKAGQPPVFQPFTAPAAPAPATPAPQSALPGGPNVAQADPEQAPPYRVAGPPQPPPQQPVATPPAAPAAQPAATPGRNDAYLQRLPTEAGRTLVKGVADYDIDPASLPGEIRSEVLAAAKLYRPDYSAAEYQKRGSPPSGEMASRIGLAKAFIERTPQIKERIQADELNSVGGRAMAMVGQGGPGELRRAIDEGSEALLRGLTGAGMSTSEATNYARRYQFSLIDTKETQLRKLNELENALRYVTTEVGKGRGGEDVLKGFSSQFGKPVGDRAEVPKVKNEGETNILIGKARDALKRDPSQRDEIVRRLRDRGVPNPELLLGQ